MGFIIVVIAIVVIVIAVKSYNGQERDSELDELKEKIHNSDIIKELSDNLQACSFLEDYRGLCTQMSYYDECERCIFIFNRGIEFSIWINDSWQTMLQINFVETLGYRPLLDNGLKEGKSHITNEDVFRVFANEVRDVFKNIFHDDEIYYEMTKYTDGYESQKDPNGVPVRVKVGDEHASIRYKVPKSVGAKQI